MKRALAAMLVILMLASVLAGCTTLEKDDKGAIINMYLTNEVYNLDPQISVTDSAMQKVFSLTYEGLTRLDENGKWQKALMKDYTIDKDNEDEFSILITLKTSYWSDGRTVQAADFVYSWKRLLDANAKYEAASLLYDLKNAYEIKMGDASIDDLGVAAVDTYTLQVKFEKKIDLNDFFTNCTSVALVPLREDVVTRYGDDLWAKKGTYIITNGPFIPKTISSNLLRLERSQYYYLIRDKNEELDKYVIPYRLVTDYTAGNAEKQLEAYNAGTLLYIGELPLSQRAELKGKATVSDMMVTQSFMFNLNNELFANPDVRKALSLAIDREKVAEMLTFAKPATGLIPEKAFNTGNGTSFRKEGGALLETAANVEEAKSLLSSSGVRGGSFSIKVRNTEADIAVAEYAAEVWESLGFYVDVEIVKTERNDVDPEVMDDLFEEAYNSGDFDVITVDVTLLSPDPFNTLSQYAVDYSGNGVDLYSENYDLYGHVSGYASEEYNEIIDKAYKAETKAERAELLHSAEKLLLEDLPIIPVAFLQDAYLANSELSGFKTDYYGVRNFNRVLLKDYMSYKSAEDTEK